MLFPRSPDSPNSLNNPLTLFGISCAFILLFVGAGIYIVRQWNYRSDVERILLDAVADNLTRSRAAKARPEIEETWIFGSEDGSRKYAQCKPLSVSLQGVPTKRDSMPTSADEDADITRAEGARVTLLVAMPRARTGPDADGRLPHLELGLADLQIRS